MPVAKSNIATSKAKSKIKPKTKPKAKPRAEPPSFVRALGSVLPVEWRRMFGGIGIYSEGIFFALISSQGLPYLRADESNRPDFEKAGSEPFRPYSRVKSRKDERIIMPYWLVPNMVLEKPATLRRWAEKALEAAQAAKAARAARSKGAPFRKSESTLRAGR